jgi:hypothetical protein
MAVLSLRVHHHEKKPGSMESRLVRVTPYVRITRDSHPPLYVQGGRVFSEGGPEVETLPAWFGEEMARLSPKVREEIGWTLERLDSNAGTATFTSSTANTWACPECDEVVEMKRKGIHIAAHRKAERKGA